MRKYHIQHINGKSAGNTVVPFYLDQSIWLAFQGGSN